MVCSSCIDANAKDCDLPKRHHQWEGNLGTEFVSHFKHSVNTLPAKPLMRRGKKSLSWAFHIFSAKFGDNLLELSRMECVGNLEEM